MASHDKQNADHPSGHDLPPERLSVGEKIGYGLGDTASNFYWKTFESFLIYFYTDVYGLPAKATATMLLLTRTWDAINDPLLGYLADRTRSRFGRFRPYLLWMPVPLAIAAMLAFYTPNFSPTGKLVYAATTYTLLLMAYTAINVPYGALMGVISSSSLERTSVSTYRFVAAFAGGILVQSTLLKMVCWFGADGHIDSAGGSMIDEQAGFFWSMSVFSVVAVVLFLVCFASTRERLQPKESRPPTFAADMRFGLTSVRLHQVFLVSSAIIIAMSTNFDRQISIWIIIGYLLLSGLSLATIRATSSIVHRPGNTDRDQAEHSTLRADFDDLLRNTAWMALFGYGLFQLLAGFVRNGATVYYFKYYCGDLGLASRFLVTGSVAAIVGTLFARPLASRFSKRSIMIALNVIGAVAVGGFYFLSPSQWRWMLGLQIVASLVMGTGAVLLWAMYADVADESEHTNQRRATGLIFSAATFSQKLGCSIGAALAGFALDYFDYLPPINGIDFDQSATTLWGLGLMMSLLPAFFHLLAAACLIPYRFQSAK